MAVEDKARGRVESRGFGEEAQRRIRPPGPAAARMDFFNGLLGLRLKMTRCKNSVTWSALVSPPPVCPRAHLRR